MKLLREYISNRKKRKKEKREEKSWKESILIKVEPYVNRVVFAPLQDLKVVGFDDDNIHIKIRMFMVGGGSTPWRHVDITKIPLKLLKEKGYDSQELEQYLRYIKLKRLS